MDREHVKGAAEKAKGAIKDTVGKITGDKELQTEGKLDKAKGEAHNIAGDVRTPSARLASKHSSRGVLEHEAALRSGLLFMRAMGSQQLNAIGYSSIRTLLSD